MVAAPAAGAAARAAHLPAEQKPNTRHTPVKVHAKLLVNLADHYAMVLLKPIYKQTIL